MVVNKWDLAEKEGATQDWYKELVKRLPFVSWAPFLFASAMEGPGVLKVLDRAAAGRAVPGPLPDAAAERAARAVGRVPGADLRGHRVQLSTSPRWPPRRRPSSSRPATPRELTDDYRRFIENLLRYAFGLEVPMRLIFKERKRRARARKSRTDLDDPRAPA